MNSTNLASVDITNLPPILGGQSSAQLAPNGIYPWDGHLDEYSEYGGLNVHNSIPHVWETIDLGLGGERRDFFPISKYAHIDEHGELTIDWAGIDKVIDEVVIPMVNAGKTLVLTLFHWEYLREIDSGWENPKMVKYFTKYIEQLLKYVQGRTQRSLSEVFRHIILANEPLVFFGNTLIAGKFPPYNKKFVNAYKSSLVNLANACNILNNHILNTYPGVETAISNNIASYKITGSTGWQRMLEQRALQTYEWHDQDMFYWIMNLPDPVLRLHVLFIFIFGLITLPKQEPPVSAIALNFWQAWEMRALDLGRANHHHIPSEYGWDTNPLELLKVLLHLGKRYPRKEIIITEVGVHTQNNQDKALFIAQTLAAVSLAINAGVNVSVLTLWSILVDNLEFHEGISHGGVHSAGSTGDERIRLPVADDLATMLDERRVEVPVEWLSEAKAIVHKFQQQES